MATLPDKAGWFVCSWFSQFKEANHVLLRCRPNFFQNFAKLGLALMGSSEYYIRAAFFGERNAVPVPRLFEREVQRIDRKKTSENLKKVLDSGEAGG